MIEGQVVILAFASILIGATLTIEFINFHTYNRFRRCFTIVGLLMTFIVEYYMITTVLLGV